MDNDGTTHLKGWYFFFTAPYSPEWWPIESFWAYGEHFVALAKNCYVAGVTRTVAQTIQMIRDRWHATPTEPQPFARMFKSCEADMNAFISAGEEKRGPLRCTIEALVGGPSSVAEKAEWQRLFGLAVGGDIVDEVFVGEELEIDDMDLLL